MSQKYGGMANQEDFDRSAPCVVCDDPAPRFSWTDYHGEGYCLKCGTPYQLKAGELKEGETYPRVNVVAVWLPVLRQFWADEHMPNGFGSFMGFAEYPDQLEGRRAFNAWADLHPELLPQEVVAEGDTPDTP